MSCTGGRGGRPERRTPEMPDSRRVGPSVGWSMQLASVAAAAQRECMYASVGLCMSAITIHAVLAITDGLACGCHQPPHENNIAIVETPHSHSSGPGYRTPSLCIYTAAQPLRARLRPHPTRSMPLPDHMGHADVRTCSIGDGRDREARLGLPGRLSSAYHWRARAREVSGCAPGCGARGAGFAVLGVVICGALAMLASWPFRTARSGYPRENGWVWRVCARARSRTRQREQIVSTEENQTRPAAANNAQSPTPPQLNSLDRTSPTSLTSRWRTRTSRSRTSSSSASSAMS
jgi:hypothetical protein